MVLINVGHPSDSDRLEKVLGATMGRVFKRVLRDPVKAHQQRARRHRRAGVGRGARRAATRALPPDLAAVSAAAAARLAPALPGGAVYTDDRAPVEWLIDASIVHVAAEGDR